MFDDLAHDEVVEESAYGPPSTHEDPWVVTNDLMKVLFGQRSVTPSTRPIRRPEAAGILVL